MQDAEDRYSDDRRLRAAAIVYTLVMIGAFAIGLYGLFSLFWLATSTAEQSLRAVG